MAAAAREAKIGYATVRNFEKGKPGSSGFEIAKVREERSKSKVIPLEELSRPAAMALDDFGFFRRRYFGRLSTPWQEEAGYSVLKLLRTPRKEFAVINCPPGSGKSTLFTHDIPAWLTVKDRGIRGLIGSASTDLAKRYTLALRTTFENMFPWRAEPELLELGLAVDAEATLAEDFGPFRPEQSTMWSTDAFIVAQHAGMAHMHKEPSWSAYGPDARQIGGRYGFIIWDDLVDDKTVATLEAIEKQRGWWDKVGEKRLEPGGLSVLQGQRIGPEDLYRYNLDKESGDSDWSDHECCEAEPGRKYHHIRYRAHAEDRCQEDHGEAAAYFPDGCLLDPRRLPMRELEAEQKASESTYQTVFQQEDSDPERLLVQKLWVTGGTDPVTREIFPGCWDNDRGWAELPKGLAGQKVSVAAADPSPTKMWAAEWWIYTPASEFRYLMALERKAMDAPDFLDWNHAEGVWTGLMEDWHQMSVDVGCKIDIWVVEQNAAQRFLLQYEHVRRWMASRGVRIIGHETHFKNKSDRNLGVWSLGPHWRHGRVRLPGKSLDRGRVAAIKLVDEVTRYDMGRYDDCVMAEWMFEWNLPKIYTPKKPPARQKRPSWLAEERQAVMV